MSRITKASSFVLKIIAMVTMAIDHIGVVYDAIWGRSTNIVFWEICRYIGRLALPLYCFLLVEAVIHTTHYKKYNIKLAVMAIIISIGLAIAQFVPNIGDLKMIADAGNIFLDLLLGSIMIYCLNHKNKWIKPLALLPFAYAVLSFTVKAMERASCPTCYVSLTTTWFPGFLRLQYDWLSLAFMLGYFLSYYLANLIYKLKFESTGVDYHSLIGTKEYRMMVNLSGVLFTIIISFLYYMFVYINPDIVFWIPRIQLFSIAASLVIIFYSGERGYNAKWFNWFSYSFYLVHIGVIFGICYLIYIL